MQLKLDYSFENFINKIETFLNSRKNLMVYDDYKDSLLNEAYRFVYSSPNDFLEFIFVDVYKKHSDSIPLAVISIITSNKIEEKSFLTTYGEVTYEAISVRGIEKTKVSLNINFNGYENLEEAVVYFENSLI